MKALIMTYKGFEESCSEEVFELLSVDTKIKESVVIADVNSEKEICLLTYRLQSAVKVLGLLGSFEFKTIKDIGTKISKINLKTILKTGKSFVVRCSRFGKHNFKTQDIEKSVGSVIFEKYKNKVNLEDPDYIFHLYLYNNKCYFGIDYAGIDLSKREYKIFSHPSALKGPVAFLLLKTAGYDKSKVLLDPFCGSGTIPIEASLHASTLSHNYYSKNKLAFNKFIKFDFDKVDKKIVKDKLDINGFDHNLQSISSSNKNAKVAGVEKLVNFSRVDVEWIDTKLDKESVDLVVTNPPIASKIHPPAMIEKIYKELFYQLDFVLKKEGKIAIISRKIDLIKKEAEKKGFKVKEEREIMVGKERFYAVLFSKNPNSAKAL
ncbi:methyltransferase [Candidatus Woesearchaeota archaeon]|nr:methyltransferase [Candidatus Woesearchaeota archaeon]MBW3021543.1 methyltransferase [Candidatus Woesearchaeota archaeon]